MNILGRLVIIAIALMLVASTERVRAQAPGRMVRVTAASRALSTGESDAAALANVRAWDTQISNLSRAGMLVRTSTDSDTLVSGRTHERYVQRHRGVRVFGGDMTRQVNAFGQAESVFGTYYSDIAIDVSASIDAARAHTLLAAEGRGIVYGRVDPVELEVLPTEDGNARLVWSGRVMSAEDGRVRRIFIDASTGKTVRMYDDTQTQSPSSGKGFGVLGDLKKISVDLVNSVYLTIDQQRPSGDTFGLPAGANITFDMKGNLARFLGLVFPTVGDIGSDLDNVWSDPGTISDPGIVDAHAYAGYMYDYYFKRFGRRGLDNANVQIWSFTNIVRASDWPIYFGLFEPFFDNASYLGDGIIYYGVGLPPNVTAYGLFFSNLAGALDIVVHELTHGVTGYSSNLVYQDESGALNESFSDMMGQSAQFFFKPPADAGASPLDWLIGEDVVKPIGGGLPGGRSMAAPFTSFGDPDHYSIRLITSLDNGGVHANSSIVNNMFYLSIMGGTNRVSGLPVTGVGFANRDQIERCIYRAFTQLLTSNATFSTARAATVQAARDLFGTNSGAERALTQAWTAVGVS